MFAKITWFKQSAFLFDHDRKIYVDPWDVPDEYPKADLIFISHAHYDHFDLKTIERLVNENTQVVAPHDVASELKMHGLHVVKMAPEETKELLGIHIETFPAYNIEKDFHPQSKGWLGYVLDIGGTRYYHAGDTDRIPEMTKIKCDVALLPIGGTYTMNVEEAVQAASDINPRTAIPMHYGFVVGAKTDGELFKKLSRAPVELLNPAIPFQK